VSAVADPNRHSTGECVLRCEGERCTAVRERWLRIEAAVRAYLDVQSNSEPWNDIERKALDALRAALGGGS
jgi:hypothetical protein